MTVKKTFKKAITLCISAATIFGVLSPSVQAFESKVDNATSQLSSTNSSTRSVRVDLNHFAGRSFWYTEGGYSGYVYYHGSVGWTYFYFGTLHKGPYAPNSVNEDI